MGSRAAAALVNNQFNSPMKLYSPEVVAETLSKQTQILANGALGINFHKMAAPGNLANSAVLRMLEEESKNGGKENIPVEYSKPRRRVQRFDWPPKIPTNHDTNNNEYNEYNNEYINDNDMNNKRDAFNKYDDFDGGSAVKKSRHHFTTTTAHLHYASPGVKCVSWPPPPEQKVINVIEKQLVYSKEPAYQVTSSPQGQPVQQPPFDQSPSRPAGVQTSTPTSTSTSTPTPTPTSPNAFQPAPPVYQRIVQAPAPVYDPPPTFVTLRQQAPVSQATAPVFPSQPAATRSRILAFTPGASAGTQGSCTMMRGDQKWPPAEQKAQAVAENQARQALAKGPAVRPRAVKKDYSQFFAQNAITTTYPGYRAPPGTQHYVEEGTSNF